MKYLFAIVVVCLFVGCAVWFHGILPTTFATDEGWTSLGGDWKFFFYPATIEILNGNSPFNVHAFFSPPWVLIPMIPLALLHVSFGAAVLFAANIFAFIYTANKLKMNVFFVVVFVLFSRMLVTASWGNIDGLVAFGFVLPPQIGLFFALSKPQIGIAVAAYWAFGAWKKGGFAEIFRIFSPVTVAVLASFALYGFWPLRSGMLSDASWNTSMFPHGVIIGVALLGFSLWKRKFSLAIAASPFFAPYLAVHSWSIVWLGGLAVASELLRMLPEWLANMRILNSRKHGVAN